MMVGRLIGRASVWTLALVMFMPGVTFAQSAIAGVVRDTTGAVVPGVSVEASSPALIEKVRTAVTDGQGVYRVVDLRPGTYAVTFTLSGFNTVRRDGIELPASFTATVNVEMRVGALAETVTVSGEAPAVDVQSSTQRNVFSNEFFEALPALRGPQMYVTSLPAVTGVGTTLGANGRNSRNYAIHNSRSGESVVAIDGFGTQQIRGVGGSFDVYYVNQAIIEELSVELGTGSAERQTGGVFTNIIPKEGGNTFSGAFYGNFMNEQMQSDNLNDALQARGLSSVNKRKKYWDLNPAFGGPVVKDSLWFYSSARYAGNVDTVAGMYYDRDPDDWVYTPDLSRPAIHDVIDYDVDTRLTWQATPRDKLIVFYSSQPRFLHYANLDTQASTRVTPEASTDRPYKPNAVVQIVWKSPLTSRLLLEAGFHVNVNAFDPRYQADQDAKDTISALDQSLNLIFRAAPPTGNLGVGQRTSRAYSVATSASYITGSHAFKFGMNLRRGWSDESWQGNGSMQLVLAQGVPQRVTLAATPIRFLDDINADLGLYAQDSWTFSRLTIGAGLRYDYFNSSVPAQALPAGRFVPARSYPAIKNAVNFHDLTPRLGMSYDLFGDGRTALKATFNRYVEGIGATGLPRTLNPVSRGVLTADRSWTDSNGNYEPDCDLVNPIMNGECGRLSNVDFGKANPRVTMIDPDTLEGFGTRSYNWETSVSVERELMSRISANIGYFRRWYGNFTTTDNLEVTSADYDPFCMTAPAHPRLPNGGGDQICGLYDVKPAAFGQVRNYVTFSENFPGVQREVYNGVDLTLNARFGNAGRISGGLSTGRTAVNDCVVVDSPEAARFCSVTPPFLTRVKFTAVYPLPWWGLQAAAVLQNIPGQQITASYVASSAEIRPSLNRDLASGPRGTRTVQLIAPGTMYDERANQLDLRLGKIFRVGQTTIRADVDLFNLFNGSAVTSLNTGYGPAWLQPREIQPARFVQFSTAVTF